MSDQKTIAPKSEMPLAMGLAFVAFTTQFGGGFASGAQIYQYFINYGAWCLILPLLTQGLYALFFGMGCVIPINTKLMIIVRFQIVFMENIKRSCLMFMKSVT